MPAPTAKVYSYSEATSHKRFRELALRQCELAAREGIHLVAYASEELEHFSLLHPAQQRSVLEQLSETNSIYEEMSAESLSLRDNPQLIWRSMRRSGLTPPGDLFDKISYEDIVVIFSPDQRQLFRNLEFLRHSVLTLEELCSTEWYRYTKRDPKIVQELRALVSDIMTGKRTGTFHPQIEDHVIEQVGSQGHSQLRISISAVSPITSEGAVVAIAVVERAWPVGTELN